MGRDNDRRPSEKAVEAAGGVESGTAVDAAGWPIAWHE
jgi:hypothetical protein